MIRTKRISLKYHWFKSFIKGPNNIINIKYVNTKKKIADAFTKLLDEPIFTYLRRKASGW